MAVEAAEEREATSDDAAALAEERPAEKVEARELRAVLSPTTAVLAADPMEAAPEVASEKTEEAPPKKKYQRHFTKVEKMKEFLLIDPQKAFLLLFAMVPIFNHSLHLTN